MDRRRALAISAAVAATTVGAVAAIATNFGLLGFGETGSGRLGKLEADRTAQLSLDAPTTSTMPGASTPNVVVRYEDMYLPAPAAPAASVVAAAPQAPVTAADAQASPMPTTAAAPPDGTVTDARDGGWGEEPGDGGEHGSGGSERGEPEHAEDD